MPRDSLQLGMDGRSPRLAPGLRDWDGSDHVPAEQDISSMPVTASSPVDDDTDEDSDEFDFAMASY